MAKRAKYIENVAQLIKDGPGTTARLVITSCNFTENELTKHFQDSECALKNHANSVLPKSTLCMNSGWLGTSEVSHKKAHFNL